MHVAVEKADYALRTERFAFFAPQPVWDAYQEELLTVITVDREEAIGEEEFPGAFLRSWGWLSERLPTPVCLNESEWRTVLEHYGIVGWKFEGWILHADRSVSVVRRLYIYLGLNWGRADNLRHSEKVQRLTALGFADQLSSGRRISAEIVVVLEHYPRLRIAKIIRKLRDRFQKDPILAVQTARSHELVK